MSIGGKGDPYRPPCGGWTGAIYSGPRWQHYRPSENHIQRYKNTTTVPNPFCGNNYGATGQDACASCSPSAQPAMVPPFQWANCLNVTCAAPVDCQDWTFTPDINGYTNSPPARLTNTFAPYEPAQYLDLALCHKTGFKNVFAQKYWQGRFGIEDFETCNPCPSPPDGGTPTSTRYRTITWSGSGSNQNKDGVPTTEYTCSGSITVDRYSGNLTGTFTEHLEINTSSAPQKIVSGDSVIDLVRGFLNMSYCGGAWVGGSGAGILNSPGTGGGTGEPWVITTSTVSNTGYHVAGGTDPGSTYYTTVGRDSFDVTITLSDPYSWSDVNADANALLAQWDMSNDAQYPWRNDNACNRAPIVTYDEGGGAVPATFTPDGPDVPAGFTSGSTSGTDANGYNWAFSFTPATSGDNVGYGPATADYSGNVSQGTNTGTIIGAPTPAGYDKYFDSQFPVCDNATPPNVLQWGDYAPFWCPQATRWVNSLTAPQFYAGAFAMYNNRVLTKAKWAEIILWTAPSYNFGRPWGYRDSLLHDQTTVNCGTVGGGGCAGPYPNQYGDLLFPTCPGIDGRNIITDATDATPIQITLSRPAGWRTGDSISIANSTGNTAANGTWAITVLSPSIATLDGSSGNGTYNANSGYAVSAGAAPYQWDDNQPKGDWCLLTWTYDYRSRPDLTPTSTSYDQKCSKFVPCCPAVVYITPQDGSQPVGETNLANNSQSFPHPNLNLDDCYGGLWQSIPKQWMVDPLWQKPVCPCDNRDTGSCTCKGPWVEDDGSGLPDDPETLTKVYPQRPWVECRAALPVGAPALPPGYSLINPEDVGTTPPGQGVAAWRTWWTWSINRTQTVALSGRFACEYADPMAVCTDDSDVSPL